MKKIFLGLFLAVISIPLFAAYNTKGIPDSSEIREGLVEKWFEAPLSEVRTYLPEVYVNSVGEKFQVRLEENDASFNVFVAPATEINVNVYSNAGVSSEKREVFPGDGIGSWVLVRDKKTGNPIRIRYYFLRNSEVFIQFTPHGKTSLADLVIFENYAARGVPAGIPFSNFYTASFAEVMKVTKTKLPWKYVQTDNSDYHSILQMAAIIHENLPYIIIADDAMYDEDNKLVSITTGKELNIVGNNSQDNHLYLSSAGFLKWIADGLVEPVCGSQIKRSPLILETVNVKDTGYQGILSQKYNLFFGLDWIRNLASAVISVFSGKTYKFNQSGVDVTINPFAASISAAGTVNTVTFIENTGYNVAVLKSLLYVLAATEPEAFYFGAIRETDRTVSPEVKVFNNCVVFLPYFDEQGGFNCFVFMNGRQYSLEDFCTLYADDFVYLTRAKSKDRFFPHSISAE